MDSGVLVVGIKNLRRSQMMCLTICSTAVLPMSAGFCAQQTALCNQNAANRVCLNLWHIEHAFKHIIHDDVVSFIKFLTYSSYARLLV
jgi:hypothetical protein